MFPNLSFPFCRFLSRLNSQFTTLTANMKRVAYGMVQGVEHWPMLPKEDCEACGHVLPLLVKCAIAAIAMRLEHVASHAHDHGRLAIANKAPQARATARAARLSSARANARAARLDLSEVDPKASKASNGRAIVRLGHGCERKTNVRREAREAVGMSGGTRATQA
jgi:phage terminase small subunit